MADMSAYRDLSFEAFRERARDPSLTRHEKVGFPDSFREGREAAIFDDVVSKLGLLHLHDKTVIEIGPGCSALPVMLADLCARQGHRITFVDSEEMLALLPQGEHIHKIAGAFPAAMEGSLESLAGRVDVIFAYSVVQYVFAEGNLWAFLDHCLALLANGGELLLGDIPNSTMRKRYLASPAGERGHKALTGSDEKPSVQFNVPDPGQMDDSVVLALLARARAQGFHAWVLPQPVGLPMGNRREDILIRRP